MNEITKQLLGAISDFQEGFTGAFNIRVDGGCADRQSTENILITSMTDKPGMEVHVRPGTKGETVYIPACVTHGNVDDLVYNDFYIGEDCDVTVVAGCGVHNEEESAARHNGIHRFFLAKGAKVLYLEKHIGTGVGAGQKVIDPVTEVDLAEEAVLTMDTTQLGGVDRTRRVTTGKLAAGARLIIRERLMTDGDEWAKTDFDVELNGEGSGVDLVSRSVAKGNSHQEYRSRICGNAPCTGHSECDAIIVGNATVSAAPELEANHGDAELIHEAAIGKIAGEQILKLRTLGLTEEEAEAKIIAGFLK